LVNPVIVVALSTLTLAAPLIFAAMGGYTSERSGVINIGLEGKMLMAAAATALGSAATGSAILGLLVGIGAAIVLSLFHWLLTQQYRVDHIISGMGINAIAFGGTNFLHQRFTDRTATELPLVPLWVYYAAALLLPPVLALYAGNTRGGLRLIAVGGDPDKARLMGVKPVQVRLVGLLATGVFCGLSGAMILTNAGGFTDGMTAGRGFIALAALIIGGWRPVPALVACFVFGLFEALQIQLQGTMLFGARIPSEAWQSLPYLITILALAGLLGRSRSPLGLGKP
jgi:general nucleoside transport system permease protein